MNLKIKGYQGTSLIDYPDKISSIIFTGGCNFRCPFCHNPQLVLDIEQLEDISLQNILNKLEKRKKFIDAVAITGGEPLLYPDILLLIKEIKKFDFLVKIDTNGSFPETLKILLDSNSIDFVAMDVKSSLANYNKATGVDVNTDNIKKSINLLLNFTGSYEFRITIVPGIVSKEDIIEIRELIKGAKNLVLQQFRNSTTLDPVYGKIPPYSPKELKELGALFQGFVEKIHYRGI